MGWWEQYLKGVIKMKKRILIACEESQTICNEFRKQYPEWETYSCDIKPCSGGHPEWHLQCDVKDILLFNYSWDLIIAHPPCTYLSNAGACWYNVSKYGEKAIRRFEEQKEAISFFMLFTDLPCEHVAIENPVGVMSTKYRKPDQIVQPYYFGDPANKRTCLWLKNLPKLTYTNIVEPEYVVHKNGKKESKWHYESLRIRDKELRSTVRSKTFPGMAQAIVNQWGAYLNKEV